jgi:hypothetical protein
VPDDAATAPVGAEPDCAAAVAVADPAGAAAANPAGAEPVAAEPAGAEPVAAEPAGAEPVAAEPAGAEPADVGADAADPEEPLAADPAFASAGSTAGRAAGAACEEVGWLLDEPCVWEAAEPEVVAALPVGAATCAAFCAGGSAFTVDDDADAPPVGCEDEVTEPEMMSPSPR